METSEEHRLLHRLSLDFVSAHNASSNKRLDAGHPKCMLWSTLGFLGY